MKHPKQNFFLPNDAFSQLVSEKLYKMSLKELSEEIENCKLNFEKGDTLASDSLRIISFYYNLKVEENKLLVLKAIEQS